MTLQDFIVTAKKKTYAAAGETADELLADDSKVFVYQEGEYKYQDKYYGYNPFSGQEIVWQNSKPIWIMSYYGQVLSDKVNPKEIYTFLRSAMLKVKKERPWRGPNELVSGYWKYSDVSQGDLDNFFGQEEIYFKNQKVYQLDYFGGELSR